MQKMVSSSSLTFAGRSHTPRALFGVVLEPFLNRFVSDQEPKALLCRCVFCSIQIEVVERDIMRHRFRPAIFNRGEVELIALAPVVTDEVSGAVLERERQATGRGAAEIHVIDRWRDEIRDRIGGRIRYRIRKRDRHNRRNETERMVSVYGDDFYVSSR